MIALDWVRRIVSGTRLPGRYVLAELAARLFAPRNGRVEGYLGRYRFTFDFRDLIQRQIYFGLYDPLETRLLGWILKPGDVFVDVGANVGYYSLIASQLVGAGGRVHAFEPIPQNVRVLEQAIADNGITNITVNPVAVGAQSGSLDLFVADQDVGNSGWASVVPSLRRPCTLTVDKVAIDDYLAATPVDRIRLVKLDIEGSELDALHGMARLLQRADAPDLFCEANPFLLEKLGLTSCHLTRVLDEHGYSLYEIADSGLESIDPCTEIVRQINLFATKASGERDELYRDLLSN